jgi:hypothetical protein
MIGRDLAGSRGIGAARPIDTRKLREPSRTRLPAPDPGPEPVYDRVRGEERVAVRVREVRTDIVAIRRVRWETASDERTCPECAPLHGRTWREDQPGPTPPLHVNCRCRVVPARTEWQVRRVVTWRTRWITQPTWEWRRTGWA